MLIPDFEQAVGHAVERKREGIAIESNEVPVRASTVRRVPEARPSRRRSSFRAVLSGARLRWLTKSRAFPAAKKR